MEFVYHSVSNACVLQEKTGGGERKKKIRTNLKLKKTHLNPKKVRKKKEKKYRLLQNQLLLLTGDSTVSKNIM